MQAARDYEGRGVAEKVCDQRDARLFFFSRRPDYVWYRHLWFSLARVPIPDNGGMALLVSRLSAVYKASQRDFGNRIRYDEGER